MSLQTIIYVISLFEKKTASFTSICHGTVIVPLVVMCRYWYEASGIFPLHWLAYSISQEFMTLQKARGRKHSDAILYGFIITTLTGQYFVFCWYWWLYRKLAYTYWVKPWSMPESAPHWPLDTFCITGTGDCTESCSPHTEPIL